MSGFDSNPFADPYASSPFSDPAITQVTSQQTTGGLGDYNPFGDAANKTQNTQNKFPAPPTQPQPSSSEPAVLQPITEPPPAYSPTGGQSINTADLHRKQEELERKAAELQAKEEALKRATQNVKANNWPPIPEKCCTGPCFYQDINVEIPTEYQKLVRTIYYLWMFYVLVLFLNVCGGLAILIATGDGVTFGFSILMMILFTPLSFVCWFRPLYKAFRSDSSFNFMVFFFMFFAQFVLTILYTVGIPGMGACGLIEGITTISYKPSTSGTIAAGCFIFAITIMWGALALAILFFLLQVHKIYRGTGASFAKAQQEFTVGVLRNEHVQNAAAAAAAEGARQTLNQSIGVNRY